MAVNQELLDILACPQCRGGLEPAPDGEALACPACRLIYEIKDDIPIMLIEEAKPMD